MVLSERFLPGSGGSITWLYETYRRFAPGKVVVVAGANGNTELVDKTLPFKVERICMSMDDWDPTRPASFLSYLRMFLRVRKILRQYRLSQIHCMKVLPEGMIACCLRYVARVPYILYAHGEEIQMRLTSRKLGWLIPPLYKAAAKIIANSEHTKALLQEIGVPSARIHVIHPGVEAAAFQFDEVTRRAVRQHYKLDGAPVLLTVGRLQRRKGQDMVIKALLLIRKKYPDIKYLIVGGGEELESLQLLAKEEGVQDNVIFTGRIPDEERSAYYAACDIFIMPNRQIGADIEGFGMVFLEAGAAGKPVIGGRSGGTGEAIQEGVTGMRVDGDNVEEIAAAVMDLLANSKKAHVMGEQGRLRVKTAFSWDSIVARTRQVATAVNQGV